MGSGLWSENPKNGNLTKETVLSELFRVWLCSVFVFGNSVWCLVFGDFTIHRSPNTITKHQNTTLPNTTTPGFYTLFKCLKT